MVVEIEGISLKGFKEINGHGDSRTFEATVCMNGKKIGSVGNNGWGGPNEYHFDTKRLQEEFMKLAKEYLTKQGEKIYPEYEDIFIENLITKIYDDKIKIKNFKKGFPVTIIMKKGKRTEKILDEKITYYDKEEYIGLKTKEQIPIVLKKYGYDEYEEI